MEKRGRGRPKKAIAPADASNAFDEGEGFANATTPDNPAVQAKRGRGRPKKAIAPADASNASDEGEGFANATTLDTPAVQVKRGRGRPKKDANADASNAFNEGESFANATTLDTPAVQAKRGRGRPKKDANADASNAFNEGEGFANATTPDTPAVQVKRGRGRPKKDANADASNAARSIATATTQDRGKTRSITAKETADALEVPDSTDTHPPTPRGKAKTKIPSIVVAVRTKAPNPRVARSMASKENGAELKAVDVWDDDAQASGTSQTLPSASSKGKGKGKANPSANVADNATATESTTLGKRMTRSAAQTANAAVTTSDATETVPPASVTMETRTAASNEGKGKRTASANTAAAQPTPPAPRLTRSMAKLATSATVETARSASGDTEMTEPATNAAETRGPAPGDTEMTEPATTATETRRPASADTEILEPPGNATETETRRPASADTEILEPPGNATEPTRPTPDGDAEMTEPATNTHAAPLPASDASKTNLPATNPVENRRQLVCALESLPQYVKIRILYQMADVASLSALVRSSRKYYRLYVSIRGGLLPVVTLRELSSRHIDFDAPNTFVVVKIAHPKSPRDEGERLGQHPDNPGNYFEETLVNRFPPVKAALRHINDHLIATQGNGQLPLHATLSPNARSSGILRRSPGHVDGSGFYWVREPQNPSNGDSSQGEGNAGKPVFGPLVPGSIPIGGKPLVLSPEHCRALRTINSLIGWRHIKYPDDTMMRRYNRKFDTGPKATPEILENWECERWQYKWKGIPYQYNKGILHIVELFSSKMFQDNEWCYDLARHHIHDWTTLIEKGEPKKHNGFLHDLGRMYDHEALLWMERQKRGFLLAGDVQLTEWYARSRTQEFRPGAYEDKNLMNAKAGKEASELRMAIHKQQKARVAALKRAGQTAKAKYLQLAHLPHILDEFKRRLWYNQQKGELCKDTYFLQKYDLALTLPRTVHNVCVEGLYFGERVMDERPGLVSDGRHYQFPAPLSAEEGSDS